MKITALLLLALLLAACGGDDPTPQPTRAIAPTFTPQQLVAPTPTVPLTETPLPVLEPTAAVIVPTDTIAPTVAPPVASGPTANDVANVRSGPGTEHATVGSVAAGQALTIVGRNAAGDWYQLADGNWIAAFLVAGAPADLPVVEAAPVAAPVVPAATDTPLAVATVPAAPPCDCLSGDTLNCTSFNSAAAAHACYDYCMQTTGLDVHDLDGDEDGQFCESQ